MFSPLVAAGVLLLSSTASATPGVLSPLPPMGFNDWSRYMGGLNQSLFIDTAHAMTDKGLLAAGYNRLNLDDEWSTMERLPNGSMTWDTEKFPDGLPWLTKTLKSLGFIPGIYTDAGNLSCGGFPGALNHEEIDAHDFASWGFEYLKMDGCHMPDTTEETYKRVYGKWHTILSNMSSPMIFSESAPAYFAEADNLTDWYAVMNWVPQYGQLARHSRDTLVWNSTNYWPNITGWDSIMFNYGQEIRLARFQRPGYFNDPDFLNVDHFDYTLDEKRSHFALWASFSAPLILSTDLLNITDDEVAYLTNKDIIDIDQDPLVQQATLVIQSDNWDVLTKSLYNGDRLVTFLNKGNNTDEMSIPWSYIGINPDILATPETVDIKNLWTGETSSLNITEVDCLNSTSVPKRGTALFRISNPTPGDSIRVLPTGQIFNTFSMNCLTASKNTSLTWERCSGTAEQVWRFNSDGSVETLSDECQSMCITEDSDLAKLASCQHNNEKSSQWNYFVSGNIIGAGSGNCLTEGNDSMALVQECGYLTNEQVVAVPVGVSI